MNDDCYILNVIEADSGKRADLYISEQIEVSRSFAAKLCEDEMVLVNEKPIQKKYKVCMGDVLNIQIPELEEIDAVPEDIELNIVYEDDSVIVVNKPQGMVVHPAPGNEHGTLVNGLLFHCKEGLSGINGVNRPGIVHRIDKDTSGLLVVAKTNEAHTFLTEQWHTSKPERRYIALVHGNIKEDELTIDFPIGRSKNDRKKMAVVQGGREAITHVKVLERFSDYTLVECKLDTGRTHQIRVHLSYIMHPIVGDAVYGTKKESFNLNGQLLHAKSLGFIHPKTNEKMVFSCETPSYFEKVLEVLRNRKNR